MSKYTIAIIAIMIASHTLAEPPKDSDLDGVPDQLDQCPNTPFLNEVNRQGCTSKILTLPQDSSDTNLIFALGYGYFTDEDLTTRARRYSTKAQVSYYHDNWSYTLKSSYFSHEQEEGLQDTILKIKKRFPLDTKTKLSLGAGVKLPTYDFQGNRTDYALYTSLTHYANTKYSYFTGASYSFIQDKAIDTAVQNSYNLYLGNGYFFSTNFYASLSYNFGQSKFKKQHHIHTLASTLYYKINKRFFTTLSYQREIGDEDLHDALSIKIGINLW